MARQVKKLARPWTSLRLCDYDEKHILSSEDIASTIAKIEGLESIVEFLEACNAVLTLTCAWQVIGSVAGRRPFVSLRIHAPRKTRCVVHESAPRSVSCGTLVFTSQGDSLKTRASLATRMPEDEGRPGRHRRRQNLLIACNGASLLRCGRLMKRVLRRFNLHSSLCG